MSRLVCKHGNRRASGICPLCDAERMAKRQRKADRAAFKARIARILGRPMTTEEMQP